MLTRILAVTTAVLAALVVHQYNRIGELRGDLAAARERAVVQARASVIESMEGQGAEIRRALTWLDAYYKSSEGLQRPEGLWLEGHPDYEGISGWIFDVYLRHRLTGDNEDQARQAVVDAIKRSDEWRLKHPTRG